MHSSKTVLTRVFSISEKFDLLPKSCVPLENGKIGKFRQRRCNSPNQVQCQPPVASLNSRRFKMSNSLYLFYDLLQTQDLAVDTFEQTRKSGCANAILFTCCILENLSY